MKPKILICPPPFGFSLPDLPLSQYANPDFPSALNCPLSLTTYSVAFLFPSGDCRWDKPKGTLQSLGFGVVDRDDNPKSSMIAFSMAR